MVGNTDQPSDPGGTVEDELPGFLGGPGNLTLEHRINETHGKLQVVEEVREPCSSGTRYDQDVSVRYRTQNMGIEPVVETEHSPVETLQGIVHFLHGDFREIAGSSRGSHRVGFGGGAVPGNGTARQTQDKREDAKNRVFHGARDMRASGKPGERQVLPPGFE